MKYILTCGLISIFLISCHSGNNTQKSTAKLNYRLKDFSKLGKLHKKLDEPQPGEWLFHYNEKGQAYGDYQKRKTVCPDNSLKEICILPIGDFNELEMKLLQSTASYVSKFFMLDVELLGAMPDKVVPDESRRLNYLGEQLHTKYILDSILFPNIPAHAICFIAITNVDLYPQDAWNFVFGQAYLTKRTGVSSFRRYYTDELDSTNFQLTLNRTIKTTTHELCHMFSIKHCRIYKCLLNGANHLEEADNKPFWLCPECLAKLQWCIRFDLMKRYDELINFYGESGMNNEKQYYLKSKQLMEEK